MTTWPAGVVLKALPEYLCPVPLHKSEAIVVVALLKVIMGRSLGSAAALELISKYPNQIDGLIIESGFAFALPLLKLLGIDLEKIGLATDGFDNADKIKKYNKPTLIIHAEFDHIIPFSDGEALFRNSADKSKKMLS